VRWPNAASYVAAVIVRRSWPERRLRPERRSSPAGFQSAPERRSRPERRSKPERRSGFASRAAAARRRVSSRCMSLVVRLFSRSRMCSRSCERNAYSNSSALTILTSRSASSSRSSSTSSSTIAVASSRLSTTPTGVHTPGRRTEPSFRHRRTMTTRSRLPRIVPGMLARHADGSTTRAQPERADCGLEGRPSPLGSLPVAHDEIDLGAAGTPSAGRGRCADHPPAGNLGREARPDPAAMAVRGCQRARALRTVAPRRSGAMQLLPPMSRVSSPALLLRPPTTIFFVSVCNARVSPMNRRASRSLVWAEARVEATAWPEQDDGAATSPDRPRTHAVGPAIRTFPSFCTSMAVGWPSRRPSATCFPKAVSRVPFAL
jgi:hypothetical protein